MNKVHPIGFRKGLSFGWNSAAHTNNPNTKRIITGLSGDRGAVPEAIKHYLRRHGIYAIMASTAREQHAGTTQVRLIYVPIRHGHGMAKKYQTIVSEITVRKKKEVTNQITNWWDFGISIRDFGFKKRYRRLTKMSRIVPWFRRAHKDRIKYNLNRFLTRVFLRGSRYYSWRRGMAANQLISLLPSVLSDPRIIMKGGHIWGDSVLSRLTKFAKKLKIYGRYTPFRWYLKMGWWNKGKPWFKFSPRFWVRRWVHSPVRLGINRFMLTHLYSGVIGRPVQVKLINAIGYLAKKNKSNWHAHQNFVWGEGYRGFRFKYPEYYDIVCAAFLLCAYSRETYSLAQHFLWLFYKTLRKSYKIKHFFKFIDILISKYALLKRHFRVFRIILAGKIGGGTKRTKILKFGYGRLVLQSISKGLTRNFMPFDHTWGAFGIKLFMVRRERIRKHMKQWMLIED